MAGAFSKMVSGQTLGSRPSCSGSRRDVVAAPGGRILPHGVAGATGSNLGRQRHQQVISALPQSSEAVVVGAGLAGLNCARILQQSGVDTLLLEASDGVGGRVRTDVVDGFKLDRGFQIFLTGYPEAASTLEFSSLQLQPFYAGADVWYDGRFSRVADPLRHLADGLASLVNPIGSPVDKVNVGLFRLKSLLGSVDDIFSAPETTTLQRLKAEGFSDAIIDRFFRPFLGGIFFDTSLSTSSRLFSFVMRMLATGDNCLPAGGIGAMSEQLASQLAADSVVLGARVERVTPATGSTAAQVTLASGHTLSAPCGVVVAADGPSAARLLGPQLAAAPSKAGPGVGTCCLYFASPQASNPEPQAAGPSNILYLNGTGEGLVNNACFPSAVAPSYAPPGQTLVSVSVIGTHDELSDEQLVAAVLPELSAWFGSAQVASWRHLRTYRIPFAQPSQSPPTDFQRPVQLGGGLYVCGDHRESATFDGALRSGRRAAEALLAARRSARGSGAAAERPVAANAA